MTVNIMVRDMDLGLPHAHDSRRLEIVADGLPLFWWDAGGRGHHACLSTPLTGPPDLAAQIDGAVLTVARRKKERTYLELIGPHARARLVVLAGEVGGRWSKETQIFLRLLARAKARSTYPPSKGGTSVKIAVGLHPCMQRCSGLHCISAEPQVWALC